MPPVLSLDWTSLARSTVGASRVIFSLMLGASSSALQTTAAMFTFSLSLFYLLERRQYWLSWISPSESSDDSETYVCPVMQRRSACEGTPWRRPDTCRRPADAPT